MKDKSIEIGIELFLAALCMALGIGLCGSVLGLIKWLPILSRPYLWSTGFMLVLNVGHHVWGFFLVDNDFSDIPTDGMLTHYDFHRLVFRLLALMTIGPSVHLGRALALLRQ